MIEQRTLALELVDPRFYHLDTCFCPVEHDMTIWFPDAFDSYGQHVVREHVGTLINACPSDASKFGCNAVVIGRTVIVPAGCTQLRHDLEGYNFDVCELDLDAFLKAGGIVKCLTLRLDGEEAAFWSE